MKTLTLGIGLLLLATAFAATALPVAAAEGGCSPLVAGLCVTPVCAGSQLGVGTCADAIVACLLHGCGALP